MGIKTTPFRRICLYIIDHSECWNEIGMKEILAPETVISEVHLNPDNTATVIIIDELGNKKRLICKLFD